jgi:ubiquinone/menaquinone biosynthesis C-methylase UbiE
MQYNPKTMLSRTDDYVEYCRETARNARDPHDLALRGRNYKALTKAIHTQIVASVELCPADDLVDIGCGDGTLLRMARQIGCRSAIGLLATEEEVTVLRRVGLTARQGFTDALPIPDASASVVVCNNVLLIVPREKIPASLREIYRVSKPGARIFVGEIPFAAQQDPVPPVNSRGELLSHLYRNNGVRTWFGMMRRMAWQQLRGTSFVLNSGTAISFWAPADEFIAMGQAAGLQFVRYWRHSFPATRNNYLFRKPL